jgi:hypothetical protein
MFANVTTWLISDIARKSNSIDDFLRSWQPNGYQQFFREAAPKVVPLLRKHGMVCSYAIRTRVDVVMIVSIFEDEAGAEAGWDLISGHLHDIMDGTLEFLERSCGPVEDLFELGCVGTGNFT